MALDGRNRTVARKAPDALCDSSSQGDPCMKKWLYLAGGVTLAVVLALAPAGAQDNKAPTVKQVMKKLNAGPNSMTATIGKELQDDPPGWDDIKKETQEYVKLAGTLGANDPPKGEKESWTKLSKDYVENAKALDDATQKKDKKAALAAHKKLSSTCMTCHMEHRKK
jgi:hypothetical protein